MAINFEKITRGKVGDIIYPAYNGTNGFWDKSRWDLVTRVDKDNKILDVYYILEHATVKAIELMQELYVLKLKM